MSVRQREREEERKKALKNHFAGFEPAISL